jgi:hypothetical protein
MNTVGPGLIDPVMLASITADLSSLIGDTDAGPATVTISTPTAGPTVDYAAGTLTTTTDDDTVATLRGEVTLADVQASLGGLQLGDVRYNILASALSTVPNVSSIVIDNTRRLQVIMVSTDPLGLMYTLTARRTP